MSIIYQALQKTGTQKNGEHKNKRKPPLYIYFIIIAGIALIVIAVILLNIIYIKGKHIFANFNPSTNRHKTSSPIHYGKKYPDNTYILEGIVYDQNTPLAIINGKVLRKDDKIDNLTLKTITSKKVELYNSETNTTSTLTFDNKE